MGASHEEMQKLIDSTLNDYSENIDGKSLFEQLINKGLVWSDLLKGLVTSLKDDDPSLLKKQKAMRALINYRDVLDKDLYEKSAKAIFPSQHFTVKADPAGVVRQEPFGHFAIEMKWYTLRVFAGADNGYDFNRNAPHCTIIVKAPGSRTLTSDIDTTISVENANGILTNVAHLPECLKNKGKDYNNLIKNAMVKTFYDSSESLQKLTSGQSRDSNVYVDGFMSDNAYPKFLNEELNNPKIAEQPLFNEDEFRQFYARFKGRKHILEQAASLFSLRCYFGATKKADWDKFINETVKSELEKEIESTEFDFNKVWKDFSAIIEQVEKWHETYSTALDDKFNNIQARIKEQSPIKNDKAKLNQDITVSALNALYVEKLQIVNEIEEKLNLSIEEINNLKIQAEDGYKILDDLQKSKEDIEYLQLHKPLTKRNSEYLKDLTLEVANAQKTYEELKTKIKNMLTQKGNLLNQKQTAQIEAHLFANEAYINRSAPYHVVKGMQSGSNVDVTKQTVMGSGLQQIGFRLLHANHQKEEGYTPFDILYKNAKYGQRVFDLIFGQNKKHYTESDLNNHINSKRKNSTIQILKYLKTEDIVEWKRHFTYEELALLNLDTRIAVEVKKNDAIPEHKKGVTTETLIKSYLAQTLEKSANKITEDDINTFLEKQISLYLSIGAKLISATYLAKLESTKGYLWGETYSTNHQVSNPKTVADIDEKKFSGSNIPVNNNAKKSIIEKKPTTDTTSVSFISSGALINGGSSGDTENAFTAGKQPGRAVINNTNSSGGKNAYSFGSDIPDDALHKALENIDPQRSESKKKSSS